MVQWPFAGGKSVLKITDAEFIKGATRQSGYPSLGVSEFAFFGRSNAGKSSLINMLLNRKSLVKTGSRPGMTRQINFFLVNKSFCLADLPGYGYAQRSQAENEAFDRMLAEYVSTRETLKIIFLLMDLRREPKEAELNTVAYFEGLGKKVVLIGTKADKLGTNDIAKTVRSWRTFFGDSDRQILVSSATKKNGRNDILALIAGELK
ncbi:MAG TPA: ribosome biogenesis GTP-binding protein YihA/YsxC [Treponemataceae bacterium]|nr:ribosome biogenesis GTP-binding protein YihA/YsxC [Treponemataceae bacterium]